MRFLRCLFFMIPWLGGVTALDAVENDFHLEDALHVPVEKRHGLLMSCVLYRFFCFRLFMFRFFVGSFADVISLQRIESYVSGGHALGCKSRRKA